MTKPALIASQTGRVTHGLEALVSAQGYDPVSTLVTDRPAHGEYSLSPATIDRVEQRTAQTDREPLLVIDGDVHPGQAVDLRERLPSVTLRDKQSTVWEHLGETNPVAAARFALYEARLARREAAVAQREADTQSPTGTSGRLAARERHVERCQTILDERRETARQQVRTSYTGVDGSIVLLGRVGAPTTALWNAFTNNDATPVAGRPAQPATATTTIGPHTLAVVDTPGILGCNGPPAWLIAAVPGLTAAIEQATCLLGVGDRCGPLRETICNQFDVAWRSVESVAAARDAVRELLETAEGAIRLPYDDAAHALVSDLHDEATVLSTEYDDAIYLRIEVPQQSTDNLHRRVSAVGGELRRLDEDE